MQSNQNKKLGIFDPQPTITSCHRFLDQYFDKYREITSNAFNPAIVISPLDIYLMQETVRGLGAGTVVIDLSAGLTGGISTISWMSAEEPVRVETADNEWFNEPSHTWRKDYDRIAPQLKLPPLSPSFSSLQEIITTIPDAGSSTIFLVASEDVHTPKLGSMLEKIQQLKPDADIILLPLKKTGSCAAIKNTLQYCQTNPEYRLILPREESPFWHASGIGILSGKNADRIEQYLAHTAALLNGNFQFLDIVRRLAESEMKSSRLMQEFHDRGNKKKESTGIFQKVKGFIKRRW
jgi:hypothetical protein